jgi:uncharacterized protein YuzE
MEIDEAGMAMIYLEPPAEGLSVEQRELVADTVVADYAADGRMVALEILDPKVTARILSKAVKSVLSEFHIAF